MRTIEEILKRMNADGVEPRPSAEQPPSGSEGLVYEHVENKGFAVPFSASSENTDSDTAEPAASEQSEAPSDVGAPTATSVTDNASGWIRRAYIPTFTGASDAYRTRGDERIAARLKERKENGELETLEPLMPVDPTAEIEESYEDVPVTVPERNIPEEKIESFSVYKFPMEADLIEEINGETAEGEIQAIAELLADSNENTDELDEAVEADAVEEIAPPEEAVEEVSVPELPDPDKKDFGVFDYGKPKVAEEDAPTGLEDSIASTRDKKGRIKDSEYTNPIQRDGFKDRFLDILMSIRIRFGAALVFAVALFAVEILSVAGVITPRLFASSVTYSALAWFDYLLAACVFVVTLPETVVAAKYLSGKKFMPDLLSIVGFVVFTGYTLTVAFTGARAYPLFGFLFVLASLCSISASLYRTKADFLAFKVVSQPDEKQILDKRPTRELSAENKALDGMIDEYSSKIVRTFRTSFISEFFKNSKDVSGAPSSALTVLCVTLSVGLVAGLVAFFLNASILSGVAMFTLAFLLGCPVFSILSNKLSFYQSQRAAVLNESAAVGEGAFYEFAQADVVAFRDSDIFGPEDLNLKRFVHYGDSGNMEKAMRQMCALFAACGGPLDFMFSNVIDNRMRHKSATNIVIEDDGVSGDVIGHRVSAGSLDYMLRNGIAIPETAKIDDVAFDTTKVLYAAEDGEVYAKFYIRYSFSEEFTSVLPELKEQGIVPLIYTRDPNISNELLDTLTTGADCMRVVKIYTPVPAEEKVHGRVNAKMVTYGDEMSVINLVLLSRKYKGFAERLKFTELCATGIGLMLSVVLGIIGINSAAVLVSALWQVVWCVALHYMSKNTFLRESKEKRDED